MQELNSMVTHSVHYRCVGKFTNVKELHWWAHQDSTLSLKGELTWDQRIIRAKQHGAISMFI
jgi:hypothetical protein